LVPGAQTQTANAALSGRRHRIETGRAEQSECTYASRSQETIVVVVMVDNRRNKRWEGGGRK